METGEITVVEYARLHPLASERELRFAEIAHELNIGSLFALAYAREYPLTSREDDPAPSQTDPIATAIQTHADTPLTVENAASLSFQAYTLDTPPRSPREWAAEFEFYTIPMHIADKTLRMTKPELMAFISDAAKRGDGTDEIMMKVLNTASETFDGWAKFMHLAASRYLIAGASVAVETEKVSGGA